jgi:hypothetical protein
VRKSSRRRRRPRQARPGEQEHHAPDFSGDEAGAPGPPSEEQATAHVEATEEPEQKKTIISRVYDFFR